MRLGLFDRQSGTDPARGVRVAGRRRSPRNGACSRRASWTCWRSAGTRATTSPGCGRRAKDGSNVDQEAGSVESLLENLAALPNAKLRTKLEAAAEQIKQNSEMVRLDSDLPLPVPLEQLTINPKYDELIASIEAVRVPVVAGRDQGRGAGEGTAAAEARAGGVVPVLTPRRSRQ